MGSERTDLDNALADAGEDLVLTRSYAEAPNDVPSKVTVRAGVRRHGNQWTVVMSMTQILADQWPGGERPSASAPDPRLPIATDRLTDAAGYVATIENVDPIRLGGEVVRLDIVALV